MSTSSFTCSKSGVEFRPEDGGKCFICGKLFIRTYLRMIKIDGQLRPVCVDDIDRTKEHSKEQGSNKK